MPLLRSSKFGGGGAAGTAAGAAAAGAGATAAAPAIAAVPGPAAGGATGTLIVAAVGNTARRSPKARSANKALRVTFGATTPRSSLKFGHLCRQRTSSVTNVVSHVALDKVIRGFFTSVPALERAIHAYIERNNADPKAFRLDEIRARHHRQRQLRPGGSENAVEAPRQIVNLCARQCPSEAIWVSASVQVPDRWRLRTANRQPEDLAYCPPQGKLWRQLLLLSSRERQWWRMPARARPGPPAAQLLSLASFQFASFQ